MPGLRLQPCASCFYRSALDPAGICLESMLVAPPTLLPGRCGPRRAVPGRRGPPAVHPLAISIRAPFPQVRHVLVPAVALNGG